VDSGVLTIRGERKQEKEEKGKKFHRVERYYGTFVRSFTLPDNVDESKIEAIFKEGMLNLQIPKIEETKPIALQQFMAWRAGQIEKKTQMICRCLSDMESELHRVRI